MGFIRWLLGKKEDIKPDRIKNSSIGNYTSNSNKMIGGGHGQKAIIYTNKIGIEYKINKTYSNGVRVGNVPKHDKRIKRTGNSQSWFPKSWTDGKIKHAGQVASRGTRLLDGLTKIDYYDNVKVGIIRTMEIYKQFFP